MAHKDPAARRVWAAEWRERNRAEINRKHRAWVAERRVAAGIPSRISPAEKAELFRSDLTDVRHGTTNGYSNLGCRCSDCRAAWARHMAEYKARRAAS